MCRRRRQHNEFNELLAGVIASAVANYSLGAPEKPLCPGDFMPSRWDVPREKPKRERLSKQKRIQKMHDFFQRQMREMEKLKGV